MHTFNVSALKAFRTCPQRWWYAHVLARVPNVAPPALTGGNLWHKFRERSALGEPVATALLLIKPLAERGIEELWSMNAERQAKDLEFMWRLIQDAAPAWTERLPGRTLSAEEPMTLRLAPDVELIGIPDRVKLFNTGGIAHVQVRSLSPGTPLDSYFKAKQLDLHELIYAAMIQERWPDLTYEGTEYDILVKHQLFSDRKCAAAGTKWHQEKTRDDCPECHYEGRVRSVLHTPEETFVQELVPISSADITRAKFEALAIARRMIEVLKTEIPERNDDACLGMYGKSLCPYFDVDTGVDSIDDPALFKDADSRYALAAPVENGE